MKQKKIDEEKKQESGESRKSLSKLKEKESEKTDTLDIARGEEGDETFITSFNALEITAIRPYFDSTDLLELDERSPGVINEWMTLVKETSKSENSIRNRRSKADIVLETIGLFLGFFISMAFLYAAYDLTREGHDVAGIVLGTVDLVALVSIFVLGKKFVSEKAKEENVPPSGPGS